MQSCILPQVQITTIILYFQPHIFKNTCTQFLTSFTSHQPYVVLLEFDIITNKKKKENGEAFLAPPRCTTTRLNYLSTIQ